MCAREGKREESVDMREIGREERKEERETQRQRAEGSESTCVCLKLVTLRERLKKYREREREKLPVVRKSAGESMRYHIERSSSK